MGISPKHTRREGQTRRMNGPTAKTDRAQQIAKVPQMRVPNNQRVLRSVLPAGLLLLAPSGVRAQSFDIWGPQHPANPTSAATTSAPAAPLPTPSATQEEAPASPRATPAPAPHKPAARRSHIAPQAIPATPTPVATATPEAGNATAPQPIAVAPTPPTPTPTQTPIPTPDPIVVPDDPSPTPTASTGDFTAVTDDMWWPLAMASGLVAALLAAMGLGRLVIRRKAKAKDAAAQAKVATKPRKPAKLLPLPIPAEMAEAGPAVSAPSVTDPVAEPEPAPPANPSPNRSPAPDELLLIEGHPPETPPASTFKRSAQFADIPDVPAPTPAPLPNPGPEVGDITPHVAQTLSLTFTPTRFSTTLANAVLRYDLSLTNHADEPLGPLTIAAAMDTANSDADNPHLAPMAEAHRLMPIAPGDSTSVSGELRMVLSAITPWRVGGAELFVPMVRFAVQAARDDGPNDGPDDAPQVMVEANFLVGEPQGDAGLGPFRLDTGPQTVHKLTQRVFVLEQSGHKDPETQFANATSDMD